MNKVSYLKITDRVLRGLWWAFCVLLLACVAFYIFYAPKFRWDKFAYANSYCFNIQNVMMGCGDETPEEVVLPTRLSDPNHLSSTVSFELPDIVQSGSALMFRSNRSIEVYVGDDMRHSFSCVCWPKEFVPVKALVALIPLSSSDAGKTVRIVFLADRSDGAYVSPIMVGDRYGLVTNYLKSYGVCFFGAILLCVISIITFLVSIYLQYIYRRGISLIYMACAAFVMSSWLITDSYLFQIFFKSYVTDGIVSFLMTMLMPIPYLFYINSVQGGRYRKVYISLILASNVNFVVFTLLHFSGVSDFLTTMPYMNAIIALICIGSMVPIAIDAIRKEAKGYRITMIGLLFFIGFGILEIILLNYDNARQDGVCLLTGMVILLAMAFLQQINELLVADQQRKNALKSNAKLTQIRGELEEALAEKTEYLDNMTLSTVMTIASTVDARDKYTGRHSFHVALCARDLAREMGWDEEEAQNLYHVALLHDIGKIVVPDRILTKTGHLSAEELEIIKKHSEAGSEILKDIHILPHLQEGAQSHHERWDGKGYPEGISEDDIPLYARLIAIADAYDAMSSERVYRRRMSRAQIIEEFEICRGKQFDPDACAVFIQMLKKGYQPEETEEDTMELTKEGQLLSMVLSEYTQDIQVKAETDALTGLYNREHMIQNVNESIRKDRYGAFFMIDIDDFKSINDTHGHLAGDYVLKTFAEELRHLFREKDLLCRMGGDEFAVYLCGSSDREVIKSIAQRIVDSMCTNRDFVEKGITASVSIGISVCPDDGNDYETLYSRADKALYHVKENGKNMFYFYGAEKLLVKNDSAKTDMEQIRKLLEKGPDKSVGAFSVAYDDFQRIYKYISRYASRNKAQVQILLYTLEFENEHQVEASTLDQAMHQLDLAVVESLRKVDVGSRYSGNQYIVILVDTDIANGTMVADRVKERFYAMSGSKLFSLQYDIQTL